MKKMSKRSISFT